MRRTFEISGMVLAVVFTAMAFSAWISEHDDKLRMQATMAAQKQLLDAADARERARSSALKDTLDHINALKRSAQTPAEIIRDLPEYLPLPQPITLNGSETSSSTSPSAKINARGAAPTTQDKLLPDSPFARLPVADLKPLYDYVQDCRSCAAQLAAAKQNEADDRAKLSALTRERDAALTAAKGGTFLRRVRRNARWFGIGFASGAVAVIASRHSTGPRPN
jgi:hypothetical protein